MSFLCQLAKLSFSLLRTPFIRQQKHSALWYIKEINVAATTQSQRQSLGLRGGELMSHPANKLGGDHAYFFIFDIKMMNSCGSLLVMQRSTWLGRFFKLKFYMKFLLLWKWIVTFAQHFKGFAHLKCFCGLISSKCFYVPPQMCTTFTHACHLNVHLVSLKKRSNTKTAEGGGSW